MKELMVILFSAILTQNFVLSKFMGICPFLGVSKKMNSAVGMSAAVTFVMVAASVITWPIYTYLLAPFSLEYLSKVVFILIIALFVQLVEILIKKYAKSLYNALGVYLPLITTNCAVLGVTILNVEDQLTFLQAVINALGGGLGFRLCPGPGDLRGRPGTGGRGGRAQGLQRDSLYPGGGFHCIHELPGLQRHRRGDFPIGERKERD